MSNSSVAALSTASGLPVPILYGTAWKKERTTELVLMAVLAGFRGIDTACQPKHYAEEQVGAAMATLQAKHGIPRADIFMQTKFTSLDGQDPARVPYDRNAPLEEQVCQSFAKSLQNLRTDYLDSLVLHGPMRSTDQNVAVWRVFEHFHGEGRVRRLGLSNFYSLGQLTALYEEARVKPTILQNRFYAQTGYDREIRQFCRQKGIVYQSFWTLTANPHALRNPAVRQLAQRRGITPEQLFFRYTMDVGITPLSGTTSREHAQQDVAVAAMKPLDQEEVGTVEEALFGGGGGRKSEF